MTSLELHLLVPVRKEAFKNQNDGLMRKRRRNQVERAAGGQSWKKSRAAPWFQITFQSHGKYARIHTDINK